MLIQLLTIYNIRISCSQHVLLHTHHNVQVDQILGDDATATVTTPQHTRRSNTNVKVTSAVKITRSDKKTTTKWKKAFEKIKSNTMLPGVPEEGSSDVFFCESITLVTIDVWTVKCFSKTCIVECLGITQYYTVQLRVNVPLYNY